MTVESLVRGLQARRTGSGWMARCPSHDDRNPSLAIREQDGRLLLHCHAGCPQTAVIAALRDRGLWGGQSSGEWKEWRDGIRYPVDWGTPVHSYDYRDAQGALLYTVVRFRPKSFRPGYFFTPDQWRWRKHPQQVLYRLPEVLEAPIVFLVEGEKDVETLREWGFVATTAPGGAKAPWLPGYTETLRDREVILIPDNDEPGWKRAIAIAKALEGHAIVRALPLPQDCKDITDFFQKGHSECELIANLEGVANV